MRRVYFSMNKWKFKGSYLSYVITFFFFCFSTGVSSQVLSIYLTGIGKMTAEMTFIISSGNLFGIVLIPVFGFVKDRVRRPYMIMTTLLAAGLLSVVFAFTKSTAVLFVLHGLIVGITSALNPIFENMAGDGKYRYGLVRIWGTIGFAVSSQVAALLLDIADPKWIFFVFLLSTVLSVSCFFCTGVSAQKSVKEKVPVTEQMAFLKQPMFLLFALITIVYMSMIGLNNTFAPILLQDLGVPTSFIGTMLLVSTLFEVPLVFFSNKFMNRFSGKLLAAASCVLLMIQFLVYGLCGNVIVVCIAMMLKAVCSQLFVMTMLKVVHGIVRESAVSTALGLISSANAVGSIIAHNVSGFCVEAAGIPALYLVLGGIGALVFVLSLFVKTKATTSTFF